MIKSILINLEPYVRTVTGILMHSLWQEALIAFLACVLLSIFRNTGARVRYVISCCAMLAIVTAAVVTTVTIWPDGSDPATSISERTGTPAGEEGRSDVDATIYVPAPINDVSTIYRWWQHPSVDRYIFMIWLSGVMLFSVYHLLGWRRARRFVRRGTSPVPPGWRTRFRKLCDEFKVRRLVSLMSSSLVKVPCVVGWLKPVILVPASMFTSLDPSDIEMILVHELAHVRRYDVFINIIQTAVETLFFFNPAVWWVSRQIRTERENCCDDTAVLRTGNRFGYARALANLEELRMLQTSFGSALTGTRLGRRIQRIVGVTRPPLYSSMLSLSGMLLIASLMVVVLGSFGGLNDSVVQAGEKIEATQTFDPQPGDLRGEWETEMDGDRLKILVYGRQSSGMSYIVDPDEVGDLLGQGKGSFQIVRDAGTLFLEGTLEERGRKVKGSGEWCFRPDTAYMRFMGRYGLGEDDRQKTFSLAIFDISRRYLTEMEDLGYHDLKVDQLISAGVFGISPELVKEFREIGYLNLTYQQLLSMRVQSVTADNALEFERVGMGHLTPEQLISARIQGITPEYIESFRKAGFRDLTFNNFGTLHAFNLDVDDFEDCYRDRFMDLSQENLVWVCGFGITRKDIEDMKGRGYTDIDSIISMLAKEYGR